MSDQPHDPASIRLTLHASGFDRNEAAQALTNLPPGTNFKANVSQPAIGGPRYAIQITDLSIVGLAELAAALRQRWESDLAGEDT